MEQVLGAWNIFFSALVLVWGACVGSFLNVCIYRIPRELSVVRPRSHCPHCERMIPWYFNVPVLSFVMLRGRCAYCHKSISPRYVLVEVLVAVLFWLAWEQCSYIGDRPPLGLMPQPHLALVPVYWLIVSGLVLGTFVDFEHLIIPDRVTLGGIVAGLLCSAAVPALHAQSTVLGGVMQGALGMALGWGTLWLVSVLGRLIFRKDAMGFGDVKLLGAIGAFLGWRAVLFTIILSSFMGSVAGISMVAVGQKQMQSRIPYGPYLALAAILWMFWGPLWWDAYLNLMTPVHPYTL
ncbi:MAG: prepilin peptidase [Lentisphaerae bacterium]|nr:prepilin peptidase [Lentisphaerota bacterium]